jgi:hypothetical protein
VGGKAIEIFMFKKTFAFILTLCLIVLTASGCGSKNKDSESYVQNVTQPAKITTKLKKINMGKWLYNKKNKFFYQIGIDYCEKPVDRRYEQLSVFVPEAYMNSSKNSDGTYTCKLNKKAKIKGYSADTAPIVMPVHTPGYASDIAITADVAANYKTLLESFSEYTSEGFVYVHAGCRGAYEGAPAGVCDLKAAIRYIRYCDELIAGDAEKIFVYGTSGGGAQAAILGASGDSTLYNPYLKAIGAVRGVSDSIAGSMDWVPITSLDTANAEYEWMMGSTREGLSDKDKAVSDSLAKAFAQYINKADFTDKNGKKLTLKKSEKGIFKAGSYYEYIKGVIEKSLNNYIRDNDFYDITPQEYIDTLNSHKKWINYDKKTNKATITSVEDFTNACKRADKYPYAFDNPDTQISLFGTGNGQVLHFDKILADILTEQNISYAKKYTSDLKKTDSLGYSVEKRLKMYTPLYYLMESRKGYKKSNVAKYWRIRSGINQSTTSLTTEVNLALALEKYDGVKNVDFETVWEQGHTEAERKGTGAQNFIKWVKKCNKKN